MHTYIETYNHQNRIGVMIEFRCYDIFAFRTAEFKSFAHDIALHIAANGDDQSPLIGQPFLKNKEESVGDQFRRMSDTLGVKISVPRYEYYATAGA